MLSVLYFYISTFRSILVCAMPNVAVFRSSLYVAPLFPEWIWDSSSFFCYYWYNFSFLLSCVLYLCLVFLYFRIFSSFFLIIFLSTEIATFINIEVPFLLLRIMISALLLAMILSVCASLYQNMVTLSYMLICICLCLYAYTKVFCLILCLFPCIYWSWAHTLSYLFM